MAEDFFAIAPTDLDSDHNTLRQPLRPFAFWQLDDINFAFDSSVLLPSMTAELVGLIGLVRASPGALLSIFGHTDTTGNDEYNKVLAGRRSMALFALLTRRVDLWEFLFANPHGGDDWRRNGDFALALMRATVDDKTGTLPRGALFDRFMTALSQDPDGKPFGLPKTAFLGKGVDAKGKADFQGCSEFNPLIMFSAVEAKDFQRPERKEARDDEGAPNRRVTVFFFPADTKVTVADWPCPRALEGTAACRKRFWSDHKIRRAFQEDRREHPKDEDTFACRFYDRLAKEAVDPEAIDLQLMQAGPPRAAGDQVRANISGGVAGVAASTSEGVQLNTSSLTARLQVESASARDDGGDRYHLFDLRPVRRLISVRAQLAQRELLHSTSVGIDLIGLLARLPGADALRRSLGLLVNPPPPPTVIDAPDSTLRDFPDLDRPFANPFEPEQPPPEGRIPRDA